MVVVKKGVGARLCGWVGWDFSWLGVMGGVVALMIVVVTSRLLCW